MRELLRKWLKRRRDPRAHLEKTFAIGSQVDTVPNAAGRFGYDQTNPIPVHKQHGELEYLAALRCECGGPFVFHRVGSFGHGPDGHIVDGYDLVCGTRRHRTQLFMDMYHAGPSSLLPEGLTKGPPEGIGVPFMVRSFPDGLAEVMRQMKREVNEEGQWWKS